MPDLNPFEYNSQLVVDSRLIAEELNIEHDNFIQTILIYLPLIEKAFGVVLFETEKPKKGSKGGRPVRYALLNEDQATFLMTLSRNTPQVVSCKLKLVIGFAEAKKRLKEAAEYYRSESVPYWYKRTKIALTDINKPLQSGYFCVYLEMMNFFQQLEVRLGFIMPDTNPLTDEYSVPDVSIGKRFNNWLRSDDSLAKSKRLEFLGSDEVVDFRPQRKNKDKQTGKEVLIPPGKHYEEIKEYNHVYPKDSHGEFQVQSARSYPRKYLEIFLYYFEEIYIPSCFQPYLNSKSPDAWRQILASINSLLPEEKDSLKVTLIGKLFPLLPPS